MDLGIWGFGDLRIKGFRDLNLQNLKNLQNLQIKNKKKVITKNKMKNFRKILAHLWADVQACFVLHCYRGLPSDGLITSCHWPSKI